MMNQNRMRLSTLALSVALAIAAIPAMAQNTTSAVGGRVTGNDGKPVAGAAVTIVHKESGSTNSATTDAEGRYSARGLRVGGPYTITISKGGVTETRENVYLTLAETATLDAKLGGVQAIDKIVVTDQRSAADNFSPTAMGAGTALGRQELDAFASIQRNLQDYARTDSRVSQTDKERGEISVGGQNSRFNKITIDGVGISDTFGLESNNLPTLKQPISIDAIQSVQVNVSNYDVTQTGYTGGGINAVTKSGTNAFKGSVSYSYRDQNWSGQRFSRATGTYFDAPPLKEQTASVTLGGPIIKDKLFFFINYEDQKRLSIAPAFGPIGTTQLNQIGITPSAISSAQALATSAYNMNIGTLSVADTQVTVKDALAKVDWNISAKHRASLRYTKTEQNEPIYPNFFATPSTALSLSSNWYAQAKTVETIVGQWFADWTPTFSTETKISQRDYNSIPVNNAALPQVTLGFTGALPTGTPTSVLGGTRNLVFGTERSRHTNVLDTKTFDAYFGGNWQIGDHELKFATDITDNKIFNAFLQDTKGTYLFNCQNSSATYTYTFGAINCGTATAAQIEAAVLENFRIGRPTTYSVQVPALPGGSLNDGIAQFNLKNYGFAAQDTWSVSPNLSILYGFRVDTPDVPQKPIANAAASAAEVVGRLNGTASVRATGGFGRDNSNTIDGQYLIQPRFGFNYTFDSKRPMQLRGGVGLFQGAAANVWLSNPFSNTGVATRVVGCGGNFAACPVGGRVFSSNPNAQITNFAGAAPAANVDFIEQGLGQPAVWKANLAFEHELPWWGMVAGIEYLNTRNESALTYQHLNLGAPTRIGPDGRQLFYTPTAYNPACWSAAGTRLTTGTVCSVDNRTRALSNAAFANVLLLKGTREGGGELATASLSGRLFKSLGWFLAYTYTTATEVSGLTSSVANSNWNSRAAFNPNDQAQSNSATLVKDRINGTMNWSKAFFPGFKTTVGVFYEGRSGKPYSWTYLNDLNGDGNGGNDLMYVPSAPGSGEVVFLGDTATNRANEDRFWAIVNDNAGLRGSRGTVAKRNSDFSPWTNSIDMRISQEVPGFFKGNKGVFSFDISNVGNLLNKKWGRIDEVGFNGNGGQTRSFVNFVGIDPNGRYIYSLATRPTDFTTRQARGESQWALQITARYEF